MSQLGASQSPELEPREDWAAGVLQEGLVPLPRASVLAAAVAVVRWWHASLRGAVELARNARPEPHASIQKCGYEPTRTF